MSNPSELIYSHYPNARTAKGLWVYSQYWLKWDKVVGIDDKEYWVVMSEEGVIRKHLTPMNKFAFFTHKVSRPSVCIEHRKYARNPSFGNKRQSR